MTGCRFCAPVIDSGDGTRWTINEFAGFAKENSKAGRLRFGIFPAAHIHCIVLRWDVPRDRISGFIRERHSLQQWLVSNGGVPVNKRGVNPQNAPRVRRGIGYDWSHSRSTGRILGAGRSVNESGFTPPA
jgi:hypothetical protein